MQIHHRRSIRLPGYDYSQPGAYFITICTYQRALILEAPECVNIVIEAWKDLPNHYPHLALDVFVVMPNHVHGVIVIKGGWPVGAGLKPAPTNDGTPGAKEGLRQHGLPEIVRAFKAFSARRINSLRGTSGGPVWQRNYYERVVRHDDELLRVREYICSNPLRWDYDRENPNSLGMDKAETRIWKLLHLTD